MAEQKNQPGNRPDDVPEDEERRRRRLDRRTFIRTGLAVGAGVAASAYIKPSLQSIGIPRAFASVTPGPGHPSIEWVDDDLEFPGTAGLEMVTVFADLQDASTPPANPYSADVKFKAITKNDDDNFVSLEINDTPRGIGEGVSVGVFDIPNEIIAVKFKVFLNGNGGKVQLKIEATAPFPGVAAPDLTLTFDAS